MKRQARRDTRPELALRRELHARGLRYRVDRSPIPGMRTRADIVFGPAKLAVFVDGCFWHSCPEHGTTPKNNREWWRTKLQANSDRDKRVDRQLRNSGWLPVHIWEHEDMERAANGIARCVLDRRRPADTRGADRVTS
jgi:DNA mismatch endonuclease (patch repair protein)